MDAGEIKVAPARYVTIKMAAALTGLSACAINTRIARASWLEGRQYFKREGRIFIDMKGVESWVRGTA